MLRTKFVALMIVPVFMMACASSSVAPVSRTSYAGSPMEDSSRAQLDDVYALYSAVTSTWGPRRDLFPDVKVRVVMKDHTEPWRQGKYWAGPLPCVVARGDHASEIAEAYADYEKANQTSIALAERFIGRAEVSVGSGEDILRAREEQARGDGAGWLFVGTVSAIGFSHDRQVAVLTYQQSCGSTCGGSGYAVFARSPIGWDSIPRVIQCSTYS